MQISNSQTPTGAEEVVISDLGDEALAALKLDSDLFVVGFEFDGSQLRRTFPPGTPYIQKSIENLQRFAPEILNQSLNKEKVSWEKAADLVLQRLASTDIEWMFIGGAALLAQGAEIVPGDIDLITNVAGAKVMNDLFADCLITPTAPIPDMGYFGRAFHGVKIEWAGNDPDENPQMWHLIAAQRKVSWRGHEVRVALIETYHGIEQRRGRLDRVAAIEKVLPNFKSS